MLSKNKKNKKNKKTPSRKTPKQAMYHPVFLVNDPRDYLSLARLAGPNLVRKAPAFAEVRAHLIHGFRNHRYRVEDLKTIDLRYEEILELIDHIEGLPESEQALGFRILRARTHNPFIDPSQDQDPWFLRHRLALRKVPLKDLAPQEEKFQEFLAGALTGTSPHHQKGAHRLAIRMLAGMPPFDHDPQPGETTPWKSMTPSSPGTT